MNMSGNVCVDKGNCHATKLRVTQVKRGAPFTPTIGKKKKNALHVRFAQQGDSKLDL